MFCRTLMHESLWACTPDDSIAACADLVRRESLPMLVVLDASQRAVGVVTRRALLGAGWRHREGKVRDIMSTDLAQCRPDCSPDEVARIMAHSGAPIVFVTDNEDILGWISAHDIDRELHPWPPGLRRHQPASGRLS